MQVIRINEKGVARVLNGQVGMTFIVDSWTNFSGYKVAHVRDYRYKDNNGDYQIWSIASHGFEEVMA